MCAAAVGEVKQFPEKSWKLIDPREDETGMRDNRRQRVVSYSRAKRDTVNNHDAGKLVVEELSPRTQHTTDPYISLQQPGWMQAPGCRKFWRPQ